MSARFASAHSPSSAAPATAPLALLTLPASGAPRSAQADRLAAVLEEFGYAVGVTTGDPGLGPEPRSADVLGVADPLLDVADLVVCDAVQPDDDLPFELALAQVRGIPAIVLVPAGPSLDGPAGWLVSGAEVVRYEDCPAPALHRFLRPSILGG